MDYAKTDVWEKSMRIAEVVCRLGAQRRKDVVAVMRGQITRAAISVPSNIAEGWRRESAKEKAQFFAIAHGSLAELHTQLLLCRRLGWLDDIETGPLLNLIDEVGAMLAVLRRTWRVLAKKARRDTS